MGRPNRYDNDEDRLPEGYTCTGYDVDEGRYYFCDDEGNIFRGPVGSKFGQMDLVSRRRPSPPPPPRRVSSLQAPTGNVREVARQKARQEAPGRSNGRGLAASDPKQSSPAQQPCVRSWAAAGWAKRPGQAPGSSAAPQPNQQQKPPTCSDTGQEKHRRTRHTSTRSVTSNRTVGSPSTPQPRVRDTSATALERRTSQTPASPASSHSGVSSDTVVQDYPRRTSPTLVDDTQAANISLSGWSRYRVRQADVVSGLESCNEWGKISVTAPEGQAARPAAEVAATAHENEEVRSGWATRAVPSQRPSSRRAANRDGDMNIELPNGSLSTSQCGKRQRPSLLRDIKLALIAKLERSVSKDD